MPFANIKIPEGTLTDAQKEEFIGRVTDIFTDYYGDEARLFVMVLVEEVADGGWGRGGATLTLAKMAEHAAAVELANQ